MKMKFLLILVIQCFYLHVNAQINLENHIEITNFEDKKAWCYPMGELGIITIERSDTDVKEKYSWKFKKYDSSLSEQDRFTLGVNTHQFKNAIVQGTDLYLLYQHDDRTKFEVIVIDYASFEVKRKFTGGCGPNTDWFSKIELTKNYIFIKGKNIVYALNLETHKQTKIYMKTNSQMVNFNTIYETDLLNVQFLQKTNNKTNKIILHQYGPNGQLIQNVTLREEKDEKSTNIKTVQLSDTSQMVFGSYFTHDAYRFWEEDTYRHKKSYSFTLSQDGLNYGQEEMSQGVFISHVVNDSVIFK